MERVFLRLVGASMVIYLITWGFNHVNPWASIGMALVTIYLVIRFIKKVP